MQPTENDRKHQAHALNWGEQPCSWTLTFATQEKNRPPEGASLCIYQRSDIPCTQECKQDECSKKISHTVPRTFYSGIHIPCFKRLCSRNNCRFRRFKRLCSRNNCQSVTFFLEHTFCFENFLSVKKTDFPRFKRHHPQTLRKSLTSSRENPSSQTSCTPANTQTNLQAHLL